MLESVGASPDLDTVNEAPLELYVISPEPVKELTDPEVKSTSIDFPRAVFAGQPASVRSVQLQQDKEMKQATDL